MSTGRFAKRDREKARQQKAAAKRARRHGLDDGAPVAEPEPAPTMSQDEVLRALAALHEAYDAGKVEFDEFEERRAELTAQLRI